MSDLWTSSELEKVRKLYRKPRTTEEFITWLNSGEICYDTIQEASRIYNLDYSRLPEYPIDLPSFTFQKIGETSTIDMSALATRPMTDLSNITSHTTTGRKSRPVGHLSFRAQAGFESLTHTVQVTNQNYPELYKIGELFDFDLYNMTLQYQPTGSVVPRHVDFLGCVWEELIEKQSDILKLPYNTTHKTPEGYYIFRVLIALTDWVPGHVFGFENEYWKEWRIGDIIAFDWAHARHYTANASFVPRLFLKISGITQNKNHWIFNNINENRVTLL